MQQTPWEPRVRAACRFGMRGPAIDVLVSAEGSMLATRSFDSCLQRVAMDLQCLSAYSTSTAAHPATIVCVVAPRSIVLERVAYGTGTVVDVVFVVAAAGAAEVAVVLV